MATGAAAWKAANPESVQSPSPTGWPSASTTDTSPIRELGIGEVSVVDADGQPVGDGD